MICFLFLFCLLVCLFYKTFSSHGVNIVFSFFLFLLSSLYHLFFSSPLEFHLLTVLCTSRQLISNLSTSSISFLLVFSNALETRSTFSFTWSFYSWNSWASCSALHWPFSKITAQKAGILGSPSSRSASAFGLCPGWDRLFSGLHVFLLLGSSLSFGGALSQEDS